MPDKKPTRRELQLQRRKARERFLQARKSERQFAGALRSVALQVDSLVKGMWQKGQELTSELSRQMKSALERYSDALRPWAVSVVARMQSQISQKDTHSWEELARGMGRSLQSEIRRAPTGPMLRDLMAEDVHLITSLPLEAAQYVHEWTMRGITRSVRAEEVTAAIQRTGLVTASRARLIARTEIARTASKLTEVRAVQLGSEGYIWRTSGDADVRPLHRKLEGKFIAWERPPVAGENGERAHAGQIYNCRCWPEPVIPDEVGV